MSLPVFDPQTHLFGLQGRSSEVFSETDRYRLFAQKIHPLLVEARSKLEACYCMSNGRPGVEPVVLLGVSMLQFLERVPDRQAVELVKYHIGWKHALAQELDGEVFDPTVLVRFRERLIEHEQGRLAFELVLGGLERAGLVKGKGKQRLDSTHVLGLVSRMGTLECVRESLRLALEELAGEVGEAQRPEFWSRLWERYVDSQLDYKASAETLKQKMVQTGEEVLELRNWLAGQRETVRQGEKVQLLERVWSEQFEVAEGGGVVRKTQIPATPVQDPHEPEAQWCTKKTGDAKKEWVGYKAQVAETVPEGPLQKGEPTPALITGIVTQPATGSDEAGMAEMLQQQAAMGLDKPSELYVDGAYVSGQQLAEAQGEGRQLMGPAQPPAQTGKAAYKSDAFDIDVRATPRHLSGGPRQHPVQPAGRREDRESQLPLRMEHPLPRLLPASSVRARRAETPDAGGGPAPHPLAGAAAKDEDRRVPAANETTQRHRRHAQRTGARPRVAARPLPGAEESHAPELSDRRGLQRQTLDPTGAVGNETRSAAGAVRLAGQLTVSGRGCGEEKTL